MKSSPPKSKTTKSRGTRRKSASVKTAGSRAGTKRSDRRWLAPDGELWASRFEYEVYDGLLKQFEGNPDITVHKCGADCTLSYSSEVKHGRCSQCQSDRVVQDRTYTPDIFLIHRRHGVEKRTYLETKGYFEGSKRSLFRQVLKAHADLDIRVVAGADHWVTKGKTRLSNWAKRFKIPFLLWEGTFPEETLK